MMFVVRIVPPNRPAIRVLPLSLTGKMKASEPGVCPGIAIGVIVSSPSLNGWPSAKTKSFFGRAGGAFFPWFCLACGLAGYIKDQSAAVFPTRAHKWSWKYYHLQYRVT